MFGRTESIERCVPNNLVICVRKQKWSGWLSALHQRNGWIFYCKRNMRVCPLTGNWTHGWSKWGSADGLLSGHSACLNVRRGWMHGPWNFSCAATNQDSSRFCYSYTSLITMLADPIWHSWNELSSPWLHSRLVLLFATLSQLHMNHAAGLFRSWQ